MEVLLVFGIIIPLLTVLLAIPIWVVILLVRRKWLAAVSTAAANVIVFVLATSIIPDGKSMEAVIGIWLTAGAMLVVSTAVWWGLRKA